jgi:CubicO group peptidase (beta-lactamase class C family)
MTMKISRIIAAGFSLAALFLATANAGSAAVTLPRSTPEEQGVSSQGILDFVDAADRQIEGMHSFMLLRHGHVVSEGWWAPYNPKSPHTLYSLSKSFTSTAVGMAIADGKMSLDDTVLSYFPEDAPAEPSANLKAMRVRDLLTMSTGHHTEDLARFSFTSGEKLTKAFLALPVAHKPGTHFLYNTPATYMLSAMVQKKVGMTVLDYLRPRLLDPLGFENPIWDASPQGISLGGFGFNARTEEIAKFGQLYLQKGEWQGKHLLPAAWIEMATAKQTSNGSSPTSDWEQGYGYQFWRCRPGFYRGDGAFGQFCIVIPDRDAVIVITSGVKSMQSVMNLAWEHILPALRDKSLPSNDESVKKLRTRLASLQVLPQAGSFSSPIAAKISGKKFRFGTNELNIESLGIEATGENVAVIGKLSGTDRRIVCGKSEWVKGRTSFGGRMTYGNLVEQAVAANGAWTADDVYTAKLCFYETPYHLTLRFKFAGDELQLETEFNVSFGAAKASLVGKME